MGLDKWQSSRATVYDHVKMLRLQDCPCKLDRQPVQQGAGI
jgi:hypothetical protein